MKTLSKSILLFLIAWSPTLIWSAPDDYGTTNKMNWSLAVHHGEAKPRAARANIAVALRNARF